MRGSLHCAADNDIVGCFGRDDGSFGSETSTTKQLLRFVFFEERSCFFQVEEVSVYGHLIATGVFGDGDDVLDTMALVSEGFNEKIDIYHA
jgi:hypothetical protein